MVEISCPAGQHWDDTSQACVSDITPVPGPYINLRLPFKPASHLIASITSDSKFVSMQLFEGHAIFTGGWNQTDINRFKSLLTNLFFDTV